MDFIDEVRTRSGRFQKRVEKMAGTGFVEEATKTSFVLPFIQMLGYDIFDPMEVVPEFTADIGTKRHEKVDFALMKDGDPVVLIEIKPTGKSLSEEHISQLLRYFGVTTARFGILTDGLTYMFFSDLDKNHVMDQKPFFEFNMLEFTDRQVKELQRFTKEQFDTKSTVDAARELKYTRQIIRLFSSELSQPSNAFVRYVASQVYEGRITTVVQRMFTDLTHSAFNQFVNDKIRDRLNSALKQENEKVDTETADVPKGWVPLPDFNPPPGSPHPKSIKFWDDSVQSLEAWHELLTKTAQKMYSDGLIKIETMPIQFRSGSNAIHSIPQNPSGIEFQYYEEIGSPPLYVNTNLNAAQVRYRTIRLVKMHDKNPDSVYLEYSDL